MEFSGVIHESNSLVSGKGPLTPFPQRLRGTSNPVYTFWTRGQCLPPLLLCQLNCTAWRV